ncbi:four-carbon acid sugar kinase family protein [Geminicoccus flavidas]|uniref:four-carbon acid sugar kinase family protein n=1 Tax=Geminicoccus flavidas TaxID=2506407 RepID=UPI0013568E27|nr:four-carbon acid sugar kinase family protein [Geminicoccus flavidas]
MAAPPLLSFYGDDLTGSTDALEALGSAGIRTVLFVRPPDEHEQGRFAGFDAVGLAGTSRSQSPAWMDRHLPPAFRWLHRQGAAVCHYKVCSTFDSSPSIGSIGRALELGADLFGQACTPVVVGVPQLRRYTFMGQLFAAYRDEVYRIDRHPVMSRHPVTPMAEADLRRHLAAQTERSLGLVDLPTLEQPDADARVDALAERAAVLLFDVADRASQLAVGRQLARLSRQRPRFVVGSSGVEYALLAAWREAGLLEPAPAFASPGAVERLAVVSGSVSPTTERQIRHAEAHGFRLLARSPQELLAEGGVERAVAAALEVLDGGRSVILASALGPESAAAVDEAGRAELGRRLGRILDRLIRTAGLARAVVAGGDTSSHALGELGVLALTLRLPQPRTPGSPLCRSHRPDGSDGPELAFKGGQIGGDDYFVGVRDGLG